MIRWFTLSLILVFLSCAKPTPDVPHCTNYRQCLDDYEGRYCTNGKKFGVENDYDPFGVDTPGPSANGNVVHFSFQSAGTSYDAEQHGSFTSRSFDEMESFAKDKIREALAEFETHINLSFVETEDEEESDLKIICADLNDKAGIGLSRCENTLCVEMKGFVFLMNNPISEENFYSLALHEIGHALGLCHSNPNNIMSHNSNAYSFDSLQAGDIEGVQSIYGTK